MGPVKNNNAAPVLPLFSALPGDEVARTPGGSRAGGPAVDRSYLDTLGKGAAMISRMASVATSRGFDEGALASAVNKMSRLQQASVDGLDSAVCEVLLHQRKQSQDQTNLAKVKIKAHHAKIKQQNKKQLEQIQKRIEERRKAAKWGFLGKIFKAIGAALSAVSSIFTGPVGIAGAALLVASLVVSCTVKGEAGQWIGLGLSLAAAAFSMGSALAGEAVKQAALQVVQRVTDVASRCSDVAAYGCGIGQGAATKESMEAEASLMEIKALTKKLLTDADQEREELEILLEADSRCMEQVFEILETNTASHLAAIRA